ncbi:DUF1345 domain-containing protein [Methylopila sp. M107]|uniref:DUF1345 domain-containing protein n=1 Tax=Methylopila sp. M107 TaxID=1101190 RepID=UPI00037B0530|nr:DUF1345 domain-containing protein [Methylopila sp. M107]
MTGLAGHGLRFAVCAAIGLAVGALARLAAPVEIATAIGWDAAALAYAAHVWASLAPASADEVRAWSSEEDEGRWAITLILTAAVAASMVAIFDMVSNKSSGATLALAAATIVSSWFLLHTVFAAHYAHRCFAGGAKSPGLDFPGEAPRFADFAYYAFTIGMTFQTSDVDTTTGEMRRLTLVHGAISFVFNTVIIAISVGLASGLLAG